MPEHQNLSGFQKMSWVYYNGELVAWSSDNADEHFQLFAVPEEEPNATFKSLAEETLDSTLFTATYILSYRDLWVSNKSRPSLITRNTLIDHESELSPWTIVSNRRQQFSWDIGQIQQSW